MICALVVVEDDMSTFWGEEDKGIAKRTEGVRNITRKSGGIIRAATEKSSLPLGFV